ncbi:hypothetical protein D1AOALGA4SA_4315 [Olavius algarvensis Delta 1 endosymbiont]|nr:hypothetical protein D1AOALGA4SA_4315 [Olavius algarvensis Delta 1 endosymbiont]
MCVESRIPNTECRKPYAARLPPLPHALRSLPHARGPPYTLYLIPFTI